MPSVSAVVLTKDSERTIEACVKALKSAVDHVIVVDTGSTDNTVQIAKDNGARVYHFEWRDDFSAARNFGDSLATSDWVIHVDSDEILRSEDTDKIRKACTKFKKTTHPTIVGIHVISIVGANVESALSARMYKRGVFVWKGIVHEQLFTRRSEKGFLVASDIGAIHDGYDPSKVDVREKILARNVPLLKKGLEQNPDNALYHYLLGRDFVVVNEHEVAIPHLKRAIDLFKQQNVPDYLDHLHQLLTQCSEISAMSNA